MESDTQAGFILEHEQNDEPGLHLMYFVASVKMNVTLHFKGWGSQGGGGGD